MRLNPLAAGPLVSLAILAGSVAIAAAAPIFSGTTPGSTSIMLAAGTYDIVVAGADGNQGAQGGAPGGLGAVVEGTFTFASTKTLSILVGGQGGIGNGGGGGGGGGSFVVGPSNTPLAIGGGGGGGGIFSVGGNGAAVVTSGGAGGAGGFGGGFAGGGGGGGGLHR